MSDPVNIPIPRNTWTKVASSVNNGKIYIKQWQSDKYWQTYRVAGSSAPTISAPIDPTSELSESKEIYISSDELIDVYLYIVNLDGEVVVSL